MEAVETQSVTDAYGNTFTVKIEYMEWAENPTDNFDCEPHIWIHDGAKRSWGGIDKSDITDHFDEEARIERANRTAERLHKAGELTREIAYQLGGIGNVVDEFERVNGGVARVVYGFDHSGQSISMSDFNDRWDSGAIGIVYMTAEEIREWFGVKRITNKVRERAVENLRSWVNLMDHYVTGAVYGYVIEDPHGNEIDSCWGYYEDSDDVLKMVVEHYLPSAMEGYREDIRIESVKRTLTGIGKTLWHMYQFGITDERRINGAINRANRLIESLPEWKRKEATDTFTHNALG